MLKNTQTFLSDLWALTRSYWFSEERWAVRGLLAVVIGLKLGLVFVLVLVNQWNNAFFNTLQNLDKDGFYAQLLRFALLAASYIVIAVYELYLNQMLQIRWRRWLTNTFLGEWLEDRTYYRMQLTDHGTDNPDQRIADDLAMFCDKTLNLTLGLLSAVVSLASFVVILWGLVGGVQRQRGREYFHYPRLYGVVRTRLCAGWHMAHARHWPAVSQSQLQPAEVRGQFPLCARAFS